MGERGARLTDEATARAEALVEEWAPIGAVTSKKMFGGHGIFVDDRMFAIVDSQATVYLKADPATAAELEAGGAEKHGRMPYWSVPDEVLGDEGALRRRAATAADVARAG